MNLYDVILEPILSEKGQTCRDLHQCYFFFVHPKATKDDVKKAVQTLWDVSVVSVNTSILPGKNKRRGYHITSSSKRKKAMVKLKEGDVIDLFDL